MSTTEPVDRWRYGITAVLGMVVSPIAAIVSAYFGVQAGSAGKEAADVTAAVRSIM